jgi:hypothetical protein
LLERDGITFPLTEESRDKLDNEFWCWQIKHMAAIDYLASGRISINTASLLMSLPVDMRRALVVEVRPDNGDALQEWLIQQEAVKPQALLNVQD